jgi:hypothetical protein
MRAMEAVKLVPLASASSLSGTRVDVQGDRLFVDRLTLVEPGLASYVAETPADDRPALVERALRIGLIALQQAGVSVNVDVVRREFESLLGQTQATNEKAARALEEMLRQNFADGDGRLPRTLEKFLGDRGALRAFVNELFDESKRDSAIGRMKLLLGTYFDGDASKLALLLDPTRMNSPLHQFRAEVSDGFAKLNDRLTAIEAAATARASERAKSAAKGGDFETLLEGMLAEVARGAGDLVDRTTDEAGAVARSKKGDFVLTVNPGLTRGADLRVVVEAKDRGVSGRAMRDELREAKTNRSAAVALVAFTPLHAPSGIAPFDVRAGDVYCVIDPEAPEQATLEAAVRLARLLAIASLQEREVEVDAAAIQGALTGVREQLEAIRNIKTQLTSIGNTAKGISGALDDMRERIVARLCEAESELRAVRADAARTAGGARSVEAGGN